MALSQAQRDAIKAAIDLGALDDYASNSDSVISQMTPEEVKQGLECGTLSLEHLNYLLLYGFLATQKVNSGLLSLSTSASTGLSTANSAIASLSTTVQVNIGRTFVELNSTGSLSDSVNYAFQANNGNGGVHDGIGSMSFNSTIGFNQSDLDNTTLILTVYRNGVVIAAEETYLSKRTTDTLIGMNWSVAALPTSSGDVLDFIISVYRNEGDALVPCDVTSKFTSIYYTI